MSEIILEKNHSIALQNSLDYCYISSVLVLKVRVKLHMLWGSSAISSREESTAKYSKRGWELVPDLLTYTARTEKGTGKMVPKRKHELLFYQRKSS